MSKTTAHDQDNATSQQPNNTIPQLTNKLKSGVVIETTEINTTRARFKVQYSYPSRSNNYALIIPPLPDTGATMTNKVITTMFKTLIEQGWNALRFDFPRQDHVLMYTTFIIDWYVKRFEECDNFMICGYGSGAMLAMEVMMRRPEITSFLAVGLQSNSTNIALGPWSNPGLFIHGRDDKVALLFKVHDTIKKLQPQPNSTNIKIKIIDDDHFFTKHKDDQLVSMIREYADQLASSPPKKSERTSELSDEVSQDIED